MGINLFKEFLKIGWTTENHQNVVHKFFGLLQLHHLLMVDIIGISDVHPHLLKILNKKE